MESLLQVKNVEKVFEKEQIRLKHWRTFPLR